MVCNIMPQCSNSFNQYPTSNILHFMSPYKNQQTEKQMTEWNDWNSLQTARVSKILYNHQ